jgi:hypothetical protein
MTRQSTSEASGYCPVCGGELTWVSTAQLWPTRRSAQAVLPSMSGTCPHCGRTLMYTVVHEPAEDADT